MEFDVMKFIFVAINLLVLYFVMKRILFKPLTAHMENRTKSINDAIANADRNKTEAAELKRKYEDRLRTARDEADKILENARSKAEKEYDEILHKAKVDAEGVMVRARLEIEREKSQMVKDVRSHVAGLALAAASKVLEANVDNESNRALVDKFIDEVGAA